MAKRSRSYAHLAGVEDSTRGIPVTNGTRANGGRQPRTRQSAKPCYSYFADDPTNVTVFRNARTSAKVKRQPRTIEIRDTRPDVLKYQAIIGNIGNVE